MHCLVRWLCLPHLRQREFVVVSLQVKLRWWPPLRRHHDAYDVIDLPGRQETLFAKIFIAGIENIPRNGNILCERLVVDRELGGILVSKPVCEELDRPIGPFYLP